MSVNPSKHGQHREANYNLSSVKCQSEFMYDKIFCMKILNPPTLMNTDISHLHGVTEVFVWFVFNDSSVGLSL